MICEVPGEVIERTLKIARELPVSGKVKSGRWIAFRDFWWLEFHGDRQWVTQPAGDNLSGSSQIGKRF